MEPFPRHTASSHPLRRITTAALAASAPGSITISSRDNSVSYPLCVYPQKAVWNGSGSSKQAASYRCQ